MKFLFSILLPSEKIFDNNYNINNHPGFTADCNCVILLSRCRYHPNGGQSHQSPAVPAISLRNPPTLIHSPLLPPIPLFPFHFSIPGRLILVGHRPGKLFFPLQAKQLAPFSPSTSRLVHFSFIILLRGTQPEPSCFLCPPHFPCVGYISFFVFLVVG